MAKSMVKCPIGIRDGKTIMIADIPPEQNGLKCNCICPLCKGKFVAATLGKYRQPHFRHDGKPCNSTIMFMTALYDLLCDAVKVKKKFQCPGAYGLSDFCSFQIYNESNGYSVEIIKPTLVSVDDCEIKKGKSGMPMAAIMRCHSTKEKEKYFAVVLTPPANSCKVPKAKAFEDFPTVSIDMSQQSGLFDKIDLYTMPSEKFKKILCDKLDGKVWIPESNPKIVEWINGESEKCQSPQICIKSKDKKYHLREASYSSAMNSVQIVSGNQDASKFVSSPLKYRCPKCNKLKNISAFPRVSLPQDNKPIGPCIMCFYNLPQK